MTHPRNPAGDQLPTSTRAGATPQTPHSTAGSALEHPEWIGPYRILQVLGEGGMGVVYMAEQRQPVFRRVALKIMKPGLDTKEVVARFETERQALAVMDHPSIAKVFDGAVTENGRPYFVMELVQGIPLTDYCDSNRLRTRERVELFIQVCQAVQHAHQKGVIHRDIKPSNVLVTLQDGRPVPKVIDFGIAKATERRLGERTLVTQLGQVMGTPAFMSPEQFEMSGLDVDTRTDIYSLGVMLYVLLAGTYPFDPKELARAGPTAHQILRDTDPATPSSRILSLGDERTQIAAHRQTDPGSLGRQIRGDLDWITLKAMARDRTQRYETANALAMDLRRHLDSEPVVARPPSTAYRVDRFVRRHKRGVVFALVVALLLIGFAVTAAVQARRIARERDRAEREMAKATALNAFLQEILTSADPTKSGARDITLLQALGQSTARIDRSFAGQPVLAAAARRNIAQTYTSLGRYAEAEPLIRSALETHKAVLGPEHEEVAESLAGLAALQRLKGLYDDAEKADREALAIRRKRLGERHEAVASSLDALASTLFHKGKYDDASKLADDALGLRRQLFGEKHKDVASSLYLAATIAGLGKGDQKKSQALHEQALAIAREVLGPDHPDVALNLNALAVNALNVEDYARSEKLYREALEVTRKAYGEEHPEVAIVMENLGGVFYRTQRYKETLALLDQVIAMRRRMLGDDHTAVARTTHNMAVVAMGAGEHEASEKAFREALTRLRRTLGNDHPDVAGALVNWARLRLKIKDLDGAETLCRQALDIRSRTLGKDNPAVGESLISLGRVQSAKLQYADAERLLLDGRTICQAANGPTDRWVKTANEELVKLYEAWGKPGRAAEVRALLPQPQPSPAAK